MGETMHGPTDDLDDLLRQGIAAARAGQRDQAYNLLLRVVEQDERNVTVWLWLSGVTESLEDKEVCLENVLTLDPDNAAAHKGLKWVHDQIKAQAPTPPAPPEPDPLPLSPVAARARTAVSPAAAILREQFAQRQPPPEPEPEPVGPSPWDELEDENLCPYCAAPTQYKDKKCRSCGNKLWIKYRRRGKRSILFWILFVLQLFGTLQLAMAPLLVLVYAGLRAAAIDPTALDPFEMLNVYLGLPSAISAAAAATALRYAPRSVFFVSAIPFSFSAMVLIGLYLRWRVIYYLLLFNAGWQLLLAFAWVFLAGNLFSGALGLVISLVTLFLVFQVGEDFAVDKKRMLLQVERGLSDGNALLLRGEGFVKRKMWAMAALHFRRAAGWLPDALGCRLALVLTTLKLDRPDLAKLALEEAQRIDPHNPKVIELAALVEKHLHPPAAI
ncbi:MAG: hypothetical protein JW900_05530 [Anaerolineae bacterium]|nr:hypothetical protein [Anaerolineae bacterium]